MEYDIDHIIEEYSAQIRAEVHNRVPESDVDDVTQDILLAIVLNLETFKGNSSIKTWIYRIANHKIADLYRNRARAIKRGFKAKALNTAFANKAAYSIADRHGGFIPELLEEMPDRYARMVNQFFVQGMTYSEIAEVEHISYAATRSRYRRTIAYIRKHKLVERI